MQPAYQPFLRAAANNHHYGKASLRMISTLGSDYPEAKHFLTAEYWAQQLVSPVDFVKAFGKAECIGIDACLEIGPGATATGLGQRCAKEPTRIAWLASLNERSPEVHQQTLARLYATGAKLDWQAFFAGKERRVVALPTYPFQRQIYRAPLASDAPATPQPQHHAARCTVRRWVAYPVPPPATLARARSLCVVLGGDEATRRAVLEASSSLHAKVLTTAAELSNETEFEQLTVVYIASGHAAEASDVALALQTGAKALLEAIQQTLELRGERQRTFVLITRGAQCVDNDDRDEGRAVEAARGLPEAPLWQLVAGLRREYPGIRARCVDLPDPSTELSHLASALSPGALPDLALRDGRFYCQTLHEDVRQAGPLDAATFANGAQLVTGASGDIGRMLIDWLARHGARRILALSRSGMLGTAVEALMAAHPGLSLSTLPVDVADHASLERAVGQLAAEGQPLTGIFHLAGAIDDDMLERQTPQRLANVLASKATGAWNLHRVSKELPIEHFVAFSSASTFLGAAGQSSYLVANEFLNQLALHRRREGLPALSVAWGPWEGTQAIAAPLIQQNLELAGLRAVSAEAAFSVLGSLLSGPTSCVGCFDVDWARFMSGLSPEERSQPYFAAFAGLPGATGQLPSPVDVPRTRTPRDVAATVYTSISKVLHVPEQSLRKSDTSFVELGMDSITAVELRGLLNRELGVSLPVGFAYSYKTAREVIRFLESPSTAGAARTRTAQGSSAHAAQGEGVALVGMSCNLPGAIKSPDELWRFLVAGRDGIERIDRPIWLAELRDVPEVPDEVRFAGLIRDYADFDPDFFHISPREARYIDPQQRLILAAAWEALEAGNHAGAPIDRDRAAIYVGMGSNEFAQLLARHSESIGPHFGTGNAPSILAGRIAYFLDWHGPAVTIDTACSSSLVAILHACESIQRGDCDIALAGGINLQLLPVTSLFLAKNGALSKKGRCQPFSAGADGYVRAEGCAMVLLKSLRQALDDGDHIHAIVRGGHINQDGRTQGITAPNGRAQVQVLSGALRKAGVEPNQVTYVEAHGTGTPLGDPIEMESIHQVYGLNRSADQPLYVGSVKANVGHTESAAGAVSFIKVALMLEHARIPAQLHLAGLNPNMNLANADGRAAIIVPAESLPWDASTGRRIGAVSSFGFSGTNVHLLLEEPERPEQRAPALTQHDLVASTRHTFVLSARSDASLTALKQRYSAFLAQGRADSIADICYTASCFRPHHPRRVALDCVDVDDLVRQLAAPEAAAPKAEIEHQPNPPQLVFTLSADEAELSPFMNALSSLVPLRAASERAAREVLGLRLDALASEREPLEPDVSRRPSPILLLQLVLLRFLEDTLGEQVVVVDDSRVRPSLDQAIDSPADSRALLRDVASRLREHAPRLNFVASGVPPQHSILLGFAGTGARPPAEQTVDCSDAAALNALFGRLYALGVDVDWRRLHDGQNRRKVKLPTYAFDLQTYLPEAFRQAEAAASWLARPTQTGADLIEFQLDFDGRQPYPLAEHVLHDEVVVPGAFYLSLVCEVARVHFRRDSFTLSDVTFPEAQILENGQGYQARLSLRSADGRSYDIEALVRRAGASAWQRRASLRLDLSPLEGALPAFAPTEGNTSEARLDAESFYATLARHGSRLGGSFQCIRTIRTAAASAQCELRHEGKTDFGIAPGLFDAFLQTMGLCLPGAETDWDEVRVPYSIGRVHVGIPQIAACKTITRLERQLDVAGSQRLLVHDVLVYDLVDRPVLWLEDFATLTYRAHDSRRRPSREAEQHIYRWSWQPLRPAPAPREVYAGNAIVYCPERFNGGAASRNLRAQLTSAGAVALGELTECFRALDQAAASGGNPLDLWLIYGGAEAHVDAALIDLLAAELIALRDAISTQRRPASWTIHIVSQRCFHTGDGDEVSSVLPRIVLGFFKTLGVEHGEPRWVWHDLDDVRPDSVREHLRRPRPGGDERIVAYRRGQALVPRLGRHHLQAHIDPLPMTGTHVITGATGGVARELAKALYGAGARHFVLISRSIGQSGPDDGWSFDSSVTVKRIAVDVTHTDVLGDILDEVEREMPPIRMVFHTAAVLRDGAMAHQTARDFSDVLGAKALGAWHLHQALEARPNVRLVLFSSVGAVFGAVGQGIYAGANQFLHGLAALRTSCGLLTTCVASGGWEGTGMQKGQSGVAHKAGIANLPSSTIIDGLLGCIADGLSDGAIMNVDWDRLAAVANARGEHHAELSLFLRRERGAQTEGSMLERLMNVPKSARASYITQNLSREIAAIMEIDGDARMSGRSLRELGLDSMTALQIRQLVNQRFELNAPATLLFEVNSVRELANYVCAELDQRTRRAASDPEPAPARHDESLEAKSASDLASILSDLVDVPA
jgi:acyl transferase domain-containing protein/acyl carrier protein